MALFTIQNPLKNTIQFMKSIVIGVFVLVIFGFTTWESMKIDVCLSSEEQKLYQLIMEYRKSKGLEAIPLSAKLTLVAQTHARDLSENYTFDPDNTCNPHSWS